MGRRQKLFIQRIKESAEFQSNSYIYHEYSKFNKNKK